MRKYKTLKIGHCYINTDGDFAIAILDGSMKAGGYTMLATRADIAVIPGPIYIGSRIVANDGYWREITPKQYNFTVLSHWNHKRVKFFK